MTELRSKDLVMVLKSRGDLGAGTVIREVDENCRLTWSPDA